MTLYFASAAQTVVPQVTVSSELLLKGVNLEVDATSTFVENVPEEDRQKDLVFEWECSSLISSICEDNAGQQQFTIEYAVVAANIVEMQEETLTLVVKRQEESGLREYRKEIKLQWSKTEQPSFTIKAPEKIFASKDNVFTI